MATDTIDRLDLTRTFAYPVNGGDISEVPLTTAFWRGEGAVASGDRFVGIVAFSSSEDRHTSSQELQADGDELILVPAAALDVMIDDGTERVRYRTGRRSRRGRSSRRLAPARRASPGDSLFINVRTSMRAEPIHRVEAGSR